MTKSQESVNRLLKALEENITDYNIGITSLILNYDADLFKEDIENIKNVTIADKEQLNILFMNNAQAYGVASI